MPALQLTARSRDRGRRACSPVPGARLPLRVPEDQGLRRAAIPRPRLDPEKPRTEARLIRGSIGFLPATRGCSSESSQDATYAQALLASGLYSHQRPQRFARGSCASFAWSFAGSKRGGLTRREQAAAERLRRLLPTLGGPASGESTQVSRTQFGPGAVSSLSAGDGSVQVAGATAASPPWLTIPLRTAKRERPTAYQGRSSPCRLHRAPRPGCSSWPRSPAFPCSCPGRRGACFRLRYGESSRSGRRLSPSPSASSLGRVAFLVQALP